MSTLAEQQQALLAALLAHPAQDAIETIATHVTKPWARGLKAYQTNGHALAERALQAAYPVLTQLLGEDSLGDLARAFWHARPPVCGDLARWGAGLAAFVAASEQLADEPYLADVARVEWALHHSTSAADQPGDPTSFSLLMQHDPAQLHMRLAPGCAVLPSAWPVVSIVNAHLEATPSLEEAGQRLRAGVTETALVWRAGLQPRVREAMAGEADFLTTLLAGRSLSAALDAAPALDFNAWLPLAVQSQLLLGVSLTP
jgi:hypothetical protein